MLKTDISVGVIETVMTVVEGEFEVAKEGHRARCRGSRCIVVAMYAVSGVEHSGRQYGVGVIEEGEP